MDQQRFQTYVALIEQLLSCPRAKKWNQSLRWPLPNNPKEERELGEALTRYLWRGAEADRPTFIPPK
ncbi:hypothetical protein [Leptolyngbya sp. 7M]|uniref:hypothetical protein n=1 Tax=Leptolyngbya sp. 7M TaxID=2812896 RepID=UPI001B8BD68D|nr:hypothetical protein [Leptolyngbya sp. 7M]QYO63667.1 hypothetical protein JVX88_27950 [Leptolyngbya sp. 7M]